MTKTFVIIILIVVFGLIISWVSSQLNIKETFEIPQPHWSDNIDVIYYINLDHRKDRQTEFLDEMAKMGVPLSKLVRIPGVYKPGQGDLGCSQSHCNAMKTFLDSSYTNCIVFEDDFMFVQTKDIVEKTISLFISSKIPYDVCMLSSNTISSTDTDKTFLKKVISAQTTSGYLVSKQFAPTLLNNYLEGSKLLEESYSQGKGDHIQGPYCVDQYWKRLQSDAKWFVYEPKLGKQRDSVSDIQGGFVKMTV